MKKTLTLFLALITVLSIALVACNKKTTSSGSGNEDDAGDDFVSRTNTSATSDSDTGSTDTSKTSTSGWTTLTGVTVYVMADNVNVRSATDTSSSSKLTSVNMGTSFPAVAKNEDWYKITYLDGEAYISADYVTTDANEVNFTNLETPETLKIIEDTKGASKNEDGFQVNLRKTAALDDTSGYTTIYRKNTLEGELKLIAKNAKGNIWKVDYNGVTYYIGSAAFKYFEGHENSSSGSLG